MQRSLSAILLGLCVLALGCERKSQWLESCAYSGHCESDFACFKQVCGPSDGVHTQVDPNGTEFEGIFKRGLLSQGRRRFTTRVREEGSFTGDKLVQGKRTLPDDSTLIGEFEKDELVKGQHRTSNGRLWDGTFRKGKLIDGKLIEADGRTFRGHFVNENLEGMGSYTLPDGRLVEARFDEGAFVGYPSVTLTGGARYNGELRLDKLHGRGIMSRLDGTILDGFFEDDKFVEGRRMDPKGVRYEGRFKDGKLVAGWMVTADGLPRLVP